MRFTELKGRLLKPCPGTPQYICCGYQILNVGTNCPLNCSYCILQAYFQDMEITVFSNVNSLLNNIIDFINEHPNQIFRIGTGEFTDSLAMDRFTGWSDLLPARFSTLPNAVLELKTKTTEIDGLLRGPHRDRIVLSWSLNSPFMTAHEEHGAPGIRQRLQAARRCQDEGFALGFHFDPLVAHGDWRTEYRKTVDLLDAHIAPRGIIWMSLGALRFVPELKAIIRRRHPQSCILDGEFIVGLDGKLRYFKPIRMAMFAYMRELLEQWNPDAGLYLCMESDEVWQQGLGWSPGDSAGLSAYLDQRVRHIFG